MDRDTGEEEYGYHAFLESVDGLLMGRGTYETVLSFGDWPYEKPVVVMSRSLAEDDVPAELADRVSLTTLDPPAVMREVAEKGWSRAYVDGGRVVQAFLQHGLIEDLVLTVVPVLIGGGRRLFGELERDIELELLSARSFDSGLVQTHYRVAGPTQPAGDR